MATWSIEHIPAAGGTSTIASLATWGFAGMQIQFANWSTDQASITARGGSIAFAVAQFGYKDKIVIWRDGARFFHGWVTGLGLAAERSESRTYTITGPSWWLEHLPFTWPTWPAKEELSLGERASFRWIGFALDSAINKGAPIAKDSGNYATFILPTPDIRASSNCLEVLQRVARLHPMSAGWWDYSGGVPVFRAALRAALMAQTVTIGEGIETLGFTPLPDKQVESVHIAYNYTDAYGAHTVHNTAGTEPYGYGPNKLHIAVDVETAALASEAQSAGIAPLLYASLSPLAWSGAVNMHEAEASLPVIRPGSALSVEGGHAEWATMATVVQSVLWSVSADTNDLCTINIGPPAHLGPQDYLEFARAGTLAASSASNNPSPYDPPKPPTLDNGDTPGTLDDLNGGTAGAPPSAALIQQRLGGTFAIVGCLPLDGIEASPPRRWLRQEWSGTIAGLTYYGNGTCGGTPTGTTDVTLSGAATWSALDGSLSTNTGLYRSVWWLSTPTSGTTENPLTAGANLDLQVGWKGSIGATRTKAATTDTYAADGACHDAAGDGTSSARDTGTWSTTLSNECTEQVAIDAQSVGLEWFAADYARRTDRTGLSFVAERLRYGVGTPGTGDTMTAVDGWTPWAIYEIVVSIQQRPIDGGGELTTGSEWTEYARISHRIQADIDGKAKLDWQDAPEPPRGYALRAVLAQPIAPITS